MIPGFELAQVLNSGGATVAFVALFSIIFAESGLFFGFFLPGDSLLLTAGVLASAEPGLFPIWVVCLGCFIAAIAGDAVGYTFGKRVGKRLYQRPDSRFFKRSHLAAAEAFYERHGGKTIVVARFLPFVRTFAPIVAGAAGMAYGRFALFNFTGALIWAVGMPVAGFALGEVLGETLDRYLFVVLAIVVLVSLLPTAIHIYRHNRAEINARVRTRGREGAARVVTLPDEPVEP